MYQKALETIKDVLAEYNDNLEKEIEVLEDALYIVKKYKKKKTDLPVIIHANGCTYCPDCDEVLYDARNRYCPYCGQKLDWD